MPITNAEIKQLKALERNPRLKTHTGWNSFNRANALPNALVMDIADVETLQVVMKKIYALNGGKPADKRICVRAVAGGANDEESMSYSMSACAQGDVIIRLAGDIFQQIKRVNNKPNNVVVGANMQVGDVDKQLYYEFNLSLPTSSLIPYVSVGGLAATAGHGTGKDQPSFAGLIRAMTLCLPNGEIVRIDNTHPDFETIRASHLGLFGIVLDVELECTPAKKMRCVMEVCSVPEYIEKIKNGLYEKYPYVSAMYMPTYRSDELTNSNYNNVIIYNWEPVDKNTPDMNNNPELSKFSQQLAIDFENGLHIVDLLRTFPSLTPYYMRYFASKIGVGGKNGVRIGPWHEIVHYQTAFPWDLMELGILFEISNMPKDGVHTPEMVEAFTKLVTTLTEAAAKGEYPMVYAAYIRYLQGTNGGMSMTSHQPDHRVCSIDMTTAHEFPGFPNFFATMSKYAFEELHAKPHWGKNIPANVDYKKMYGDSYNHFLEVLERWYEEHGMKFADSALLNNTFSHVFSPTQVPTAPLSTPVTLQHTPVLTVNQAASIAGVLLKQVQDENSEEAKALCTELNKICRLRTESYFSQFTNAFFSCFRKESSPTPGTSPQLR